jgi:hypothetical protein
MKEGQMPSDRPSPKDLWTAQPTEGFAVPLEQLHAQADKLHRTVQRRNLREYIAAAIVIAAFGLYVFILPGVLMKTGSLLVIAATLFVVWQLVRRATAEPPPLHATLAELAAFHRCELVRQRDALKSVAVWYMAPFVPGMTLFIAGFAFAAPLGRLAVPVAGMMAAICAAVFGGVWRLNVWAARRLQKRIDALKEDFDA